MNDCFYMFSIIIIINFTVITFTTIVKCTFMSKNFLTIPLNCNMIPCLFQLNFVLFLPAHIFSSLIPSFSFFTPSKMTQDSFTTTRQILDVLSILISIVTYNLPTLIYTYLFILTFSLYYYINLIKLLNYEEYRNYDEIF